MKMTSSTKRYCGFKPGFVCSENCALYDGAGCAVRRIPTVLRNLEAETRSVRDELEQLRRVAGQACSQLETISVRLDPGD